jgi:2-C-methyl-D-erythritol 4-phosphate cytidylyltransferase/2-C-methyl-D-erythritol 2,4-cyclodiphosphate synthase
LTSSKCFDKDVSNDILVGTGFDVHQFEAGDLPLKLGGVEIYSELNFKAHSDGDVLIHSLIDAILGASGLGDIGMIFPDNDMKFYNIDSTKLLEMIRDEINRIGLEIVNVDITAIAEIPRLNLYKQAIQNKLSEILEIDKSWINIKATTTEKLGFLGRKEGLAVQSVVSLKYINWRNL